MIVEFIMMILHKSIWRDFQVSSSPSITQRKLMLNVVPKRWRHMYKLDVSTYNGCIEKQKGKRTVNSTYLFGLTFNRSSFLEG